MNAETSIIMWSKCTIQELEFNLFYQWTSIWTGYLDYNCHLTPEDPHTHIHTHTHIYIYIYTHTHMFQQIYVVYWCLQLKHNILTSYWTPKKTDLFYKCHKHTEHLNCVDYWLVMFYVCITHIFYEMVNSPTSSEQVFMENCDKKKTYLYVMIRVF